MPAASNGRCNAAKKNAVDRSDEKALFLDSADTNRLTGLYEDLRSWALDSACETRAWPRHLGWGVLLRRGMKEWLATCLSLSDTSAHDPVATAAESRPPPSSVQAQMVATLASIVLSRCDPKEERHEHGCVEGCCASSRA